MNLRLLAAVLLCCSSSAAHAIEFFVAPNGRDTFSGKVAATNARKTDGAFATLERARDAVRALTAEQKRAGVTVRVRGGVYTRKEPFVLLPQDSGTEAKPIAYRAYPKETPLLRGSKAITNFRPYRGSVLQADLKAQGWTQFTFRQLYFDGKRQTLARYPNAVGGDPNAGFLQTAPSQEKSSRTVVRFRPADLKPDWNYVGAEIAFYNVYNFWADYVPIVRADTAAGTLQLTYPVSYAPGGKGAERYFLQNTLEALDAPGEWYLDKERGVLYFYPPEPLEGHRVSAPIVERLIKIESKAHDLVIDGLTLEEATDVGAQAFEAERCRIQNCTVRNVGASGAGWGVWNAVAGIVINQGRANTAANNTVTDVGSHGILIRGGDRDTLNPGGHLAKNNTIARTGFIWKQGVGILLEGVGNRVAHNEISDCPRQGILFAGNELVIEFNHIFNVCRETNDAGIIMTSGRDGVGSWGSVIRNNNLHDARGWAYEDGKWQTNTAAFGVYLDDYTSGVLVEKNIISRVGASGVIINGGLGNTIVNNIIRNVGDSAINLRGMDFGAPTRQGLQRTKQNAARQSAWQKYETLTKIDPATVLPLTANRIERNIFVLNTPNSAVYTTLAVPFDLITVKNNVVSANGGRLRTGVNIPKTSRAARSLFESDFSRDALGAVPKGWAWFAPVTESTAEIIRAGQGKALRVATPGSERMADFRTPQFPVIAGRSYRLSVRLKAESPATEVLIYWQSPNSLGAKKVTLGEEWETVTFNYTVPEKGSPKIQWIRLNLPQKKDVAIWADRFRVEEMAQADEWDAWRSYGADSGTIVADPQFTALGQGNYRLKPNSPALRLGFQPIQTDKIGRLSR